MTISRQKRDGVVYTPRHIVRRILGSALPGSARELARVSLCDPACGDGAFLSEFAGHVLQALPRKAALGALGRMTGFDTDARALALCAERLDKVLGAAYPGASVKWRLLRRDALDRRGFLEHERTFTHVVGNPPYVRIQHLGAGRRGQAKAQWATLRGAADLYILFFELGLDLLKKGGVLGYITPSSWLRSDSGRRLREILASSHRIRKLLDFGEHQVFSDVTAYTLITVAEKEAEFSSVPYWRYDGKRFRHSGTVEVPRESPGKPWVPSTRATRSRLRALGRRGPTLGEVADIHVGIQTLADGVFILPAAHDQAAQGDLVPCSTPQGVLQLERWMLRPILKASVMKDGRDPVNRMVIYPYDDQGCLLPGGRIRADAPAVWAWLLSQKRRLLGRDKGGCDPRRWYAWGRSVSIVSGFGRKILTSPMNLRPNFQLCDEPEATFYSGYCVKPRNGIPPDLLLRVLNSDDMDFFVRHTSRVYQGGWMSYAKSFIQGYTVPRELAG